MIATSRSWTLQLAFFLAMSLPLAAERLKLGRSVTLDAAGLKMRPLTGFVNSPLPMPTTHGYRSRTTGERIEAHDPRELWLRDQQLAMFKSNDGRITVGELTCNVLTRFHLIDNKHVTAGDYEKARDAHLPEWNDAERKRWIEYFTGARIEAVTSKGFKIEHPYLAVSFEHNDTRAFIVKVGERRIFILFDIKMPARFSNLDLSVARCVDSMKTVEVVARDRQQTKFQDKSVLDQDPSSQYEATRRRVIENIKNLDGWWYVQTPNYVLASDMTRKDRRLALEIQRDIEIMRNAYAQLIPPRKDIEEVSVIRVFHNRSDYVNYVDKEVEWTGGVWMAAKKELVISPVEHTSKKLKRQSTLQVVYHEAFHQYIFYALDHVKPPTWFNEGHAAFFETCRINHVSKVIQVLESEKRARVLEEIVGRRQPPNLRGLLQMDNRAFYGYGQPGHAAERQRDENYALAWGLVYFLHKATDLYKDTDYAAICPAVIEALMQRHGNRHAASQAVAKVVDLDQLSKDFVDFWNDRGDRKKAERRRLFKDTR
ncbi:MAG: DUF1570 domain-containing protein [Lentisphaeria bacterium]|jgi:hypothetical protein|nr:DUF1570 domain-containing protein [Lentisphaeria bacterium]